MDALAAIPGGFSVRGQDAAVDVARALVAGSVPHAIVIVGPPSVGKATFALDLASALLCTALEPADRPCRACRGCQLVASGTHPDLHRLIPDGKAGQIRIGDPDDLEPGTVRGVVKALQLLPAEGGYRVVVADDAVRLNEEAQNAFLKTLEEPPARVAILLCTSDEERLLPTVRSRCARIRLGPVGVREIEALLIERGLVDAPVAARLARIAGGRPGIAVALAAAPDAVAARGEIARSLLDALSAPSAVRLGLVRELVTLAATVGTALPGAPPATTSVATAATAAEADPAVDDAEESETTTGKKTKASPAERRRSAIVLIDIWRAIARDLLVTAHGGRALVVDPGLLDDLDRVAAAVDRGSLVAFLVRAERTATLIARNANPELALDVLVLAWPRIP